MPEPSSDRTPGQQLDDLRALLESAPDVILRIAADGTVRFANRAPRGIELAELLGSSWLARVPSHDHARLEEVLQRVLASREAARFEVAILGGDGTATSYSSHLAPLFHDGSVEGAVLVAREAPSAGKGPLRGDGDRRRGRVLVVDDEPMIAIAIKRTLSVDHDVVTVGRGEEALTHLASEQDYDVILCDLMMPQITGMDVHAELVRTQPELAARIVFLTGGAFTSRARAFLREIPNVRLDKPFDPEQLRELVAERVRARRDPDG